MNTFFKRLSAILISSNAAVALCQPGKVYTSLEEALENPEMVYELNLDINKLPDSVDGSKTKIFVWEEKNDGTRNRERYHSLPPEFVQLVNLRKLVLTNNSFKTLPIEICMLPKLMELEISSNGMSSLPPEIGNLKRLVKLDLANNRLTELPPEIGNLTELESLDLNMNKLTDLPLSMANLKKIKSLGLFGNKFKSLPVVVSEMNELLELSIGGNLITDWTSNAPALYSLKNLKTLGVSFCGLKEIPKEFFNLTSIERLELHQNEISYVPDDIRKLKKLKILNLSNQGPSLNGLPQYFTSKERKRIQKLLPNCDIMWPALP